MLVEVIPGCVSRGEFKEVVPVSRLAYTFGWDGSQTVPPGSSLIEVDLTPKNGSTVVRFSHSGLPPEEVPGHREGWNHFLDRLAIAAAGGDRVRSSLELTTARRFQSGSSLIIDRCSISRLPPNR